MPPNEQGTKRPVLTDAELIESNYSMFFGPDETEIRCQTTRVVTVRKIQKCMCPICCGETEEHLIGPGKRAFGEIDSEPANAPGIGLWTSSTRAARRDMKTYGWKAKRIYRLTLDICPDCQRGQS
ncbi:MAG TPA: hypothetical protein VMX97_05305 [Hyphomicrobiaceae bacterium]|nr:hypothetical protein [Hyphomicrobiaceae bacterium]